MCCPLYNQRLYLPGTQDNENRCEQCQCYGHATECRYSPDVEERGLSINTKGKVSGGGVCIDCKNFTTGINCEKCLPGYYRPEGSNFFEPCIRCDCNPLGSEGDCKVFGGACTCKEGFTGFKCETCIQGFRGPKCQKCGCDTRGTMPGGHCEEHCQCKVRFTLQITVW